MKKILSTIALTSLIFSPFVAAKPSPWKAIQDPGKIVPAQGEYLVLISAETEKNPEWAAIANNLVKIYNGKKLVWNGPDIASAKEKLIALKPRYIAVLARPQEIDREVVAKLHRMTRDIDPDFYGDALWGIITGKDAKAATRLADASEPLILERGFGTTNFDQERFRTSFFITDWGPKEYIETENFVSGEKTNIKGEVIDFFAEKWGKIQPQYVLSASHATEFNLEMPFGEGLIASTGDNFYCLRRRDMSSFGSMMGSKTRLGNLAKERNLKTLPESKNPKVWIAAGNCLIGDAYRTEKSMVVSLISQMNVKQFVGYTVTSWFGEGGWGTHLAFFNNHQDTSVGQAWFFNNQELLSRLPEKIRKTDFPLTPQGFNGIDYGELNRRIRNAGCEPDQKTFGRMHDRDVVAFYGNPLFRTIFNPNAKSLQHWKYQLFENGNTRKIIVKPTQNKTRKSKFNYWFPQCANPEKGIKIRIVRAENKEEILNPKQFAFTKNFVMVKDEIELAPEDQLEILYSVK